MIFISPFFKSLFKVGSTKAATIVSRMETAGYDYAVSQEKDIHVTVYTNKVIWKSYFLHCRTLGFMYLTLSRIFII